MATPPKKIRAHRDENVLEIEWTEQSVCRLPFSFLRGRCPCAQCVDEITGVRIFDVDSAASGIQPTQLRAVGNYAIKPSWSDGHDTGLFTWEYLSELCREIGLGHQQSTTV
jgi:DUF971 family protein